MAKHPNYELFEELGRGENSVVYRAWDLALSRDVAIKQLASASGPDGGSTGDTRKKHFLQEASFLAQFEHENVLRIHTVDQERGWIVMELMKGSLTNQIATQPMPPDTVRSVLRQILGALDFLHQKDKIHGAVRPSNLLINEHGKVKLSDFEASSLDGELPVPKGSKKYLAPELIRSEFGEFSPALDLYCLGFTALELLTGKKFDSLFPGTGEGAIDADVAWLRWHSSDEPMQRVKEIAPSVPDDLAQVIDQLLKKPVDERPGDASTVLKLLDDMPLIPVQVVEPVSQAGKKQSASAAISTPKSIKLRNSNSKSASRKQATKKKKAVVSAPGKDRLNETLGKPYVLWPIVVGMLAAAVFIGLHLRGDRTEIAEPILDPETAPAKVEKSLDITLRITPDAENAQLMIGGEQRDFNNLKLMPGDHDIVVQKDGFETFTTSLEVARGKTEFDIVLEKVPTSVFVDVRIMATPANAQILVDGQAIELLDGMLRLNSTETSQLELVAQADGYQTKTLRWSMAEIANNDYDLKFSLDKLPTELTPAFTLPMSLVAKPGIDHDEATGLPNRVLVRALQDTSPLELALVTPGGYQFGVKDGELRTWELSAQSNHIEQPFYIGVDEVTNAHFLAYARENAIADVSQDVAKASEPDFPITNVSVRQAAEFCAWTGGRLPTEAEWEAAVRGPQDQGYPLPWSNGSAERNLDENRCHLFRGESQKNNGPTPVGALPLGANQLGLLNTIGNVAEWCDNQHGADQFIIKGCSFRIPPGDHIRVTWRNASQWEGASDIGMRLVVPVVKESTPGLALSFVAPTNINTLISTGVNKDDQQVYTKTAKEIADQFTAPAELVIDSGGFMGEIADVSFNPDGNQVAVGGGKVVRIWDVNSGQLLNTLRGDMSRTSYGNVNAVTWSPDGNFLLVGVSDYRQHGNIRVYATNNLEVITEVLAGHEAPARKLTFSRDGKLLASVDSDGLIIVRDWASREIQHRIPARDRDQPIFDMLKFPGNEPYLLGVDFEGPQTYSALNGQRLGARDEMPPRIRAWLVDIYNNLVKLPYNVKAQPRVLDFRMEEGRWAGAGSAVANGRSKFWIRVWESRDPVSSAVPVKQLAAYDKHRWNITAISLQPKGTLVASGDKFGEVHVWDSKTGERKFKFAGQGKPIYEVAFDEGTTRLAFGLKPHTPEDWKRNDHGTATRVLDLRQRTIADVASRENLQLRTEQPALDGASVNVRKQDAYYLIERFLGTQSQSQYRISSGRNPTAFTMLDEPKLGVEQPVVFGDNEGLLALWDSAGDELRRAFIGHGSLVSAISTASNGKLVATSSTDRTIRLWSLEDYNPTGIFDFKFENSAVRKIVPGTSSEKAGVQAGDKIVSVDGKSLTEMFELMLLGEFEYEPGQTVPVKMKRGEEAFEYEMKMADGYDFAEPVLNFYMGDNGQWIIWHPQGYYDASPGADRLIGWHINRGYDQSASFFEVQQFRKKLYRPDVIDGILEKGSLKEALAALNTKDSDKDDFDFREPEEIAQHHPPNVRITSPTNNWQTETATVTVKGDATSVNGLPLTALTLLHNGYVAKVFRPTEVNQLSMKIEHEMRLEPGANDLVLIAANVKSSSQGKHVVVSLNRPAKQELPDAIVLAIGVSDFENALPQRPHAGGDAKSFADAMKSYENGKLYGDVKTKLLSDKVTDNEVLDGFQWLADNISEGDVAIVFIASHGIVDRRGNFFIGTTNSVESKARSTAVSWRELLDTLQLDLPDSKRMVFLDLEPTGNSIRPGLRNPLLDLAAPEMGTVFLSSNTLQQKSAQLTSSDNGAFLRAVLETVSDSKFDINPGDALFNPVELAAGVTTRVKDLTQDQQQTVFFTPEFAKLGNVLELRN